MTSNTDHQGLPGTVGADAAAAALSGVGVDHAERVELRNGIVLSTRLVPSHLIRAATQRVKPPAVPMVHIADQDRDEPNPDDPAYVEAIMQWSIDQSDAAMSVGLMVGTKLEHLPDGMEPPESDVWVADIESVSDIMGLDIHIRREPDRARYLDWLRYYALQDDQDVFTVTRLVAAGALLTEEQVGRMAATFLGRDGWRTDPEPAAPVGVVSQDADRSEAADTRDGAGV